MEKLVMKNYLYISLILGLASNLYGMEKETAFTFKTQDGQEFQVEQSVAYQSQFLKNMLEEVSPTELAKTIPLTNINGKRFSAVIEVMQLYANIQTGSDYNKLSKYLNTLPLNDLSTLIVDLNFFLVPPVVFNWTIETLCTRITRSDNPVETWKQLITNNPDLDEQDIQNSIRNIRLQQIRSKLYADSVEVLSMPSLITINNVESSEPSAVSTDNSGRVDLIAFTDHTNNIIIYNAKTNQRSILPGHTNRVTNLYIMPDNTQLISTSLDNTIRVWDLATVQELYQTQDYLQQDLQISNSLYCAFLSQENQFNTTLELLNTQDGNVVPLQLPNEQINASTLSHDGKKVVVATDHNVKIWNTDTEQWQDLETVNNDLGLSIVPINIKYLSISPDGTKIIATAEQPEIFIWDNGSLNMLYDGEDEGLTFGEVVFSKNGSLVAIEEGAESIAIFDMNTLDLSKTFSQIQKIQLVNGLTEHLHNMEFTPDNKQLLITSHDNVIRLVDIATGNQRTFKTPKDTVIMEAFVSPDGNTIIAYLEDTSSSTAHTIYLWDKKTGKQRTLSGHIKTINSIEISPDGKKIASASDDNTIRLWDTKTGESELLHGPTSHVKYVFFNTDVTKLISISNDGAHIWDLATQTPQRLRLSNVEEIDISLNNKYVLVTSKKEKDYIRVWNLQTGALDTLNYHANNANTIALSPDNKWLASSDTDDNIYLYDLETKKSYQLGKQINAHLLTFSPDSTQLASGALSSILLWDTKSRTPRTITTKYTFPSQLIFNHKGNILVTRSDTYFTMYDLEKNLSYNLSETDDITLDIKFLLDTNILMLEKRTFEEEEEETIIEWWDLDTKRVLKRENKDLISTSKNGNTLLTFSHQSIDVYQVILAPITSALNLTIQSVLQESLIENLLFTYGFNTFFGNLMLGIATLPLEQRQATLSLFILIIPADRFEEILNRLPTEIQEKIREAMPAAQQ